MKEGAQLRFAELALVEHRHFQSSYLDWVLDRRRCSGFPDLISRNPLGRRALWARWFLSRRSAAFDLALLGGLAAAVTGRSRWLVVILPWVWLALPEAANRGGRNPLVRLVQLGLGDVVSFVSLVEGSVRSRSVVL